MSVETRRRCDVTGTHEDVTCIKLVLLKMPSQVAGEPIEEVLKEGFPPGVEIEFELDKDLSPRAFNRLLQAIGRGTKPYKKVTEECPSKEA